MKYFTHNSDSSKAVRLRKFVRRFGAAGYGFWWMLVEAAATDMESCGGWLHPEFDMEELALNAGFGSVAEVEPMLAMLESLRDEDGLGLVARMPDGRVGVPPLLLHLSEHLAKKQKRTTGEWVPFSGVLPQNSGVKSENSNTLPEFGACSPENGHQKPVLKERRGEERREKEKTTRPRADAGSIEDRFARFWAVVAKKVGKAQTLVEFKKINPDEETLVRMITAMRVYTQKDPQFQKDPERWVKYRRWEDEPPAGTPGAPPKPKPPRMETDMDRALARMAREMVDE